MEELLQKRILDNLTDEEKNAIIKNKKLAEKIYLIGLIDSTFLNKKII